MAGKIQIESEWKKYCFLPIHSKKNELTENGKYHNLMRWLNGYDKLKSLRLCKIYMTFP